MTHRTRRLGLLLAVAIGASLLMLLGTATGLPLNPPKTGIVCKNGPSFDLTAKPGTIQTPDGNTVYMWSYADESGDFQYPGPVLCVHQGDTVTITLHNALPAGNATSLLFPGQDTEVTASGGSAGLLTSEAASGGAVTYSFTASNPGTYLYESGTDVSQQVEMGLYGALVVRPSIGDDYAYGASTQFDSNREFLLLLGEIDPVLHHAVETGGTYDFTTLHNRYYTINGRSFPDTVQDNGSALLPTQPYGALVRIKPNDPTDNPRPALIRMVNAGVDNHPFHPHGNHTRQIAQDGRPLLDAARTARASTEHFGETIGAGQTEDFLLRWDNKSTDTAGNTFNDAWDPNSNAFPVAPPNYLNVTFKDSVTWYSGSPYLGYKGTLPTGTTSLNVCGEWYFPLHSHALNEFTNFDEGFGGMGTLLRVDPAPGCVAYPTSTKINAGTLNSGSVANLALDDAKYYKVNSTTTGTRTTDWYGQFSSIRAGASNLRFTYKGNDTLPPPAPYTQNFNSLNNSTNPNNNTKSTLPTGWDFTEAGTGANSTYSAGNGGSSTPDTYSFRSNGGAGADRAFGTLRGSGTNTLSSIIGAAFTNTTGTTITGLTISYTGEQWRKGVAGATAADQLDFQYSTNATNLTNGTWTDVNGLDFASPVTTGGSGALNGNSAANRTAISFTVTGLSIANGSTYRIRWLDFDRGGSGVADDGLSVDDLTITPVIASLTFPTTVSIWNWATQAWIQLGQTTPVGATDVTVVDDDTQVPGSAASYIGTGPNKGLVRLQVVSTGTSANFVTGGNFMRLVYDAP